MATIRFNVGTDPISGKRIKYTNDEIRIKGGMPIEFIGKITFHELNDNPAVPTGQTRNEKRVVEEYTENFSTVNKFIDSVTKLYVPGLVDGNNDPIPNAIALGEYLESKVINTFPGVAGGDQAWKFDEGRCKEMIAIRKANGELPA